MHENVPRGGKHTSVRFCPQIMLQDHVVQDHMAQNLLKKIKKKKKKKLLQLNHTL